ncbi:hypothetical protein BJ508DRAFT_410470 [Ascobolus immersus RN42]|uniref:CUE domain-containing protein n=1 Tax=Ascobolus immersus RN42 TaxID=1160509 RepID=A0A3N4INM4_ASCIM|nr:hypothetical protein BJ508DRAFT_410470 [Ascobolus immersus RN42]
MSHQDETPTIGLPQLAACLFIGFLVYRYFSSSPSPNTSTRPAGATAPATPSPAQLRRLQEQASLVQGMFPQISTNAAIWELQKNGGSVQGVVDKFLSAGRLPEPPVPIVPNPTAPRRTPSTGATASGSSAKAAGYTDLITRYNLKDRLTESGEAKEEDSSDKKGKQPAWSQNKAERAALLQKRRDEMILQARRKLEEQERKGKGKEVEA